MASLLQAEGFQGLSGLGLLNDERRPLIGGALPLDAAPAPTIASPADLPVEPGNKFREFVLRAGGGRPSLLNTISAAFGPATSEIRARKLAELQGRVVEKELQGRLTAKKERPTAKDAAGFLRFLDGKRERVFPEATAAKKAPSSFQEQVDALVATGEVTNTQAVGIKSGRLVISRDPISGEAQVIDKATGKLVGQQPATAQAQQVAPQQEIPDVTEALGASGFAKSTVNTIADLFGSDLPFADAETAAANLDNLNLRTVALASGGIDGRPNVFFQQKVDKLLPQPGEIFTGAGKSITRFKALSKAFTDEADNIENLIKTKKVRPITLDDANQRMNELRSLSTQYDEFIASAQPRDLPPLESFFK